MKKHFSQNVSPDDATETYESKNNNANAHIRAMSRIRHKPPWYGWFLCYMNLTVKPIEYGSGILVKELEDKILICAENKTRLKEGNFSLEAHEIIIEAGKGVKISSKGKDTLVISVDTIKQDEKIFDLRLEVDKRLETIEKVFGKILKSVKNEKN